MPTHTEMSFNILVLGMPMASTTTTCPLTSHNCFHVFETLIMKIYDRK